MEGQQQLTDVGLLSLGNVLVKDSLKIFQNFPFHVRRNFVVIIVVVVIVVPFRILALRFPALLARRLPIVLCETKPMKLRNGVRE